MLIYKGRNNDKLHTARFDGKTWYGDTSISSQLGGINPMSNCNPGVAILNNTLYMIYKGWNDNALLTAWFDGAAWHGNTRIDQQPGNINPESNYSPNLVVYQGKLYTVYKAWDGSTIHVAWFDGTAWHGNVPISSLAGGINPMSDYNPGMAVIGDKLHIIYKDCNNNELYTAWFDGTTWHGNTPISSQPGGVRPQSDYSPNLVAYNGALYTVYKHKETNELYVAWFDGTAWHGDIGINSQPGGINPMSNYNPGLAIFNDRLYISYKGSDNNVIYTAWFDGSMWHGNTPVSAQPGGIDPQSNYNPGASFAAVSLNYSLSDWMKELDEDLRLDKIMMPGSHDAGMSELHHCSPIGGGAHGLAKTQSLDIGQQLANGSRYFDIRVDYDHDVLVTYHRTGPSGCNGQNLEIVLDQARTFLELHPKETAIFKFSHIRSYIGHDPHETKARITELLGRDKYKEFIFKNEYQALDLAEITLRRAQGKMILVFDYDEFISSRDGRFRYMDGDSPKLAVNIVVYDKYANEDDYDDMRNDQLARWREHGGLGQGFFFLLSWTLTPGLFDSVEELAAIANDHLPHVLHEQIINARSSKPNIVYIDFVNRDATSSIIQYNFVNA